MAYLLLLLFSAAGCSVSVSQTREAPKPPPGEVWLTRQQIEDARITVSPFTEESVGGTIRTAGRVTFDDLRVTHVFSPVTGRMTKILAQPGQRVEKETPLAMIQSPDLGSALSDMVKAQAALTAAELDYRRQKDLYEAHAAAQRDYENAQSNYLQAKAEMERAQKKVRLLSSFGSSDNVTQEYTLVSPISGEVIMRAANPGIEVQGQYSGGGALELFTIGALDRVWVIADVFEMDLSRVKKGAPVSVKVVSYPDKAFSGRVEWISGALDPISRTAKVRCSIDNPQLELKPEMYGNVSITVSETRALAIPRKAVLRLGEQNVVFVQVGETPAGQLRFERRPVSVDERLGDDFLPVVHGIDRGEKIVTSGGILLLGLLS